MSAPKRKRTQKRAWLQSRTSPRAPASFKTSVLAALGGKDAYQKLTDAGFDKDLLWRQLWGLAQLKKAPRRQASNWYALPGIPLHTLRRFPDRLRRLAKEIEQVDAKIRSDKAYDLTVQFLPLFLAGSIPGAQIELRGDGKKLRDVGTGIRGIPVALARAVLHRRAELSKPPELPGLLRFYADYIDVVSRLTAHYAPKAPALLNAMMPLEMIEAANKMTRKPHANEIATLLEAAYSAVGFNETVDPHNLMMQHRRRVPRKK
jgi:hypothetical protein